MLVRLAMHSGLNTDVFWHMAAGQWMLHHHAVIRHDPFSYTITGHPWVAEEWGFEVVLAWMVAHFGPVSYWLLASMPCCAALITSVVRWRRLGAQPLWSAALGIMVAMGLAVGLAPRPQVLSYAFFASELLILTLARRDVRWLISLPVLMVIWANVHGSFLAGLGILVLDVVLSASVVTAICSPLSGRRLRITRPLPFKMGVLALGASVLASCINPHGPALYTYALKVSTSGKLAGYIDEWRSPDFHSTIIVAALALPTLAAVAILASGRRHMELFDVLIWLVFLFATLRAVRFLPYAGIALGGVLASLQPIRHESIKRTALSPLLAAVLCLALLGGGHPHAGTPQTTGPLGAPVRAAAWLSQQGGRVFSTYSWNDYLISQRIPVFVDGRTDMYFGTGILTDYLKVSSLAVDPDPILSHFEVEWVLWPQGQPLSMYLAHDTAWRLVRAFGSEQVFQRVQAGL